MALKNVSQNDKDEKRTEKKMVGRKEAIMS